MNEKEKELKAIKNSITHWKIMIKWVKTQNKNDYRDSSIMLAAIFERWSGKSCPLCQFINDTCENCPLSIKYGACVSENSSNEWLNVCNTSTWGEWLIKAKKMLKQLESLLE